MFRHYTGWPQVQVQAEVESIQRFEYRADLIEPHNQVEVFVVARLMTGQRIDAPAAVDRAPTARLVKRVDDGQYGFGRKAQTCALASPAISSGVGSGYWTRGW